ncbi:MAG: hypothetical protein AAGF27_08095 [Pseudomonadota bacterium]
MLLIRAIAPVCGGPVPPSMAGLLEADIPLAAIMAFSPSSPIANPAMRATTDAKLGLSSSLPKRGRPSDWEYSELWSQGYSSILSTRRPIPLW